MQLRVFPLLCAAICTSCERGTPTATDGAVAGDATPPRPDAQTPDPDAPVVAGTWGGYGTAPGQFVEPSSVELDREGFVYVAGHEDRVQKFTRDGELVAIWGTSGLGEGQFNHPHGLALGRVGGDLVYVGDQNNGRVQVFTTAGTFVRLWNDPEFVHIHDVGIDPATGDIFVGDYELDLVQKFTATGDPLAVFGGTGTGPGQFQGVWGISTDSTGNVYVADTFNRRVQKLDRDGVFLADWSGPGAAGGDFVKPTGVFVDASDVVHVCDSLADAVLLFAADGTFLHRWYLPEIVGDASEPEDIVLDAAGMHIYVADVRNHRVIHLTRR